MNDTRFEVWEKKLPKNKLVDRDLYIMDQCRGRTVAHLGACDAPMSKAKAEQGKLLHQKLAPVCKTLKGFDMDQTAISILAEEFGITDITFNDLSKPDTTLEANADVVVCGDIIEHVNDVGVLLANCRRNCRTGGTLLLSTINATSIKQALRGLLGREPVHPDHVAYYSYATLGVILNRFGFSIEECRYFSYRTVSKTADTLFNALYRVAPQSADGIVVRAIKQPD